MLPATSSGAHAPIWAQDLRRHQNGHAYKRRGRCARADGSEGRLAAAHPAGLGRGLCHPQHRLYLLDLRRPPPAISGFASAGVILVSVRSRMSGEAPVEAG
jgi:hypothetical protein